MGKGLRYCVIIPVRPEQREISALESLKDADVEKDRLEILVVRGQNPSGQRNEAIRGAEGEILLFLDDDSRVDPGLFRVLDERFKDPTIHGVGGPNLAEKNASLLSVAKDCVLTSMVGAARVRSRYMALGATRDATEDDLILCNFALRRNVLEKERPFDERLYPNEENELFHRLSSRGYRLVYEPTMVVYRNRAEKPLGFAIRIARYGRGRMEQTLFHPSLRSLIHLMPLGILGLLTLTLLYPCPCFLVIWLLYGSILSMEALRCSWKNRRLGLLPWVVYFLFSLHLSYALGMFLGLLRFPWRHRFRPGGAILWKRIKAFRDPFPDGGAVG